jgi:hypothetical protein
VPTFVDRGVSRDQHGGSPTVINPSFLDRIKLCTTMDKLLAQEKNMLDGNVSLISLAC